MSPTEETAPAAPTSPTQPAPDDTHGRGLAIVAMLTTELAVTRHAHGHTVTAHLAERHPQQMDDKATAC
ncbi:hypothetical protein GCM10028832_13640 [Streptomyces sparsus]